MFTQKRIFGLLAGFVLGVLMVREGWSVVLPLQPALAQAPNDFGSQEMQIMIINAQTYVTAFFNFVSWMAFSLVSRLLDPNYIFASGSNFMVILNSVWQLSRNIMNIIFAFVLVFAAVYTIIKANKDMISQHAGKFVMAVVLVNFSWFLPQLFLDFANVLTAAIYNLPQAANSVISGAAGLPEIKCRVQQTTFEADFNCGVNGSPLGTPPYTYYLCDCKIAVNAQPFLKDEKAVKDLEASGNGWKCPLGQILCVQFKRMDAVATAPQTQILNGLFINHSRLTAMSQVPFPLTGDGKISQAITFIIRQGFMLVFQLALAFALLAMTVAFLIRIPILWMTMAFMPLVFLKYVPGPDKFLEGLDPGDIMKSFIKAALLPAMVAIPLSIGYIMINAGMQITPVDIDNFGLNKINIPLSDNLTNMWQILWLCITLMIVWTGVFMALSKGGKMIESVTSKIKQTGQGYGKAAAMFPLSKIPIPVPKVLGGGNVNALGAMRAFSPAALQTALRTGNPSNANPETRVKNGNESVVNNIKKDSTDSTGKDVKKMVDAVTAGAAGDKITQEKLQDLINKLNSLSGGADHINRDNIAKELEKIQKESGSTALKGIKPADIEKIKAAAKEKPKP